MEVKELTDLDNPQDGAVIESLDEEQNDSIKAAFDQGMIAEGDVRLVFLVLLAPLLLCVDPFSFAVNSSILTRRRFFPFPHAFIHSTH